MAVGLAVRINTYTWKYDSYYNHTRKVGQLKKGESTSNLIQAQRAFVSFDPTLGNVGI